jgi:hypothetical protein
MNQQRNPEQDKSMKKHASIISLLLVVVHAYAEDIEDHKKSGNWWALVEKLSDRNPEARLKTTHALDEVLKLDKNRGELKQAIAPLLKATLRETAPQEKGSGTN